MQRVIAKTNIRRAYHDGNMISIEIGHDSYILKQLADDTYQLRADEISGDLDTIIRKFDNDYEGVCCYLEDYCCAYVTFEFDGDGYLEQEYISRIEVRLWVD